MSTIDVSGDRALLEAAALAAGYVVRWHEVWQCFVHEGPLNTDNPPTLAGQRMVWLPLTDDGDALRLAVKLRLHVDCARSGGVTVWVLDGDGAHDFDEHSEDHFADTRRAIVRAAASLPT
jgi:hypothetical protein